MINKRYDPVVLRLQSAMRLAKSMVEAEMKHEQSCAARSKRIKDLSFSGTIDKFQAFLEMEAKARGMYPQSPPVRILGPNQIAWVAERFGAPLVQRVRP